MTDSNSLRVRRHRLHKRGDHSLCRHAGSLKVTRIPVGTGWPRDNAEELQGMARRSWEREQRRSQAPGCRTGDHAQCELDAWHGVCSGCGKTVRITRSSAPPDRLRCRECQRANPRRRSSSWTPQALTCHCGTVFTQQRYGQKYCKPKCRPETDTRTPGRVAASRRRRLRVAETFDGVTDWEIFERDRWMCWLCRKRIGKKFKYPHPRSVSIDHELPLSLGGDDTALNKRAAHLGCNVARSNGRPGEQLPLAFAVEGGGLLAPQPRKAKPAKPCLTCGEPLAADKCDLHLPVYIKPCERCGNLFTSRNYRKRVCGTATCKEAWQARQRAQMSDEAKERKRRRDRERRWIDPAYRERSIAATARWHARQRAMADGATSEQLAMIG